MKTRVLLLYAYIHKIAASSMLKNKKMMPATKRLENLKFMNVVTGISKIPRARI